MRASPDTRKGRPENTHELRGASLVDLKHLTALRLALPLVRPERAEMEQQTSILVTQGLVKAVDLTRVRPDILNSRFESTNARRTISSKRSTIDLGSPGLAPRYLLPRRIREVHSTCR